VTTLAARTDRAPWSEDEFIGHLKAQGARYHDLHPFHVRMNNGELTREELRRWVINRYAYQAAIPMKDAAILSNCPEPAVRRAWIQRVIDHDGVEEGSGGIESWLRLGEALGVAREEIESERHVLPGVRFAVDAYIVFCKTQPWVIAVSSSLTEMFGPAAIKVRLEGMEQHYPWIDPAGLDYFRARLKLAPRDAQYALDLTVDRCTTRELQEQAVAALSFKCDMLWAQLEAIDAGDTRPEPVE